MEAFAVLDFQMQIKLQNKRWKKRALWIRSSHKKQVDVNGFIGDNEQKKQVCLFVLKKEYKKREKLT